MKKVRVDKDGRVVVETVTQGESLTQQQFAEMVDINNIVSRSVQTGVMPMASSQPVYADVSNLGDYHSALQKVLDANASFMQLDPKVRMRFENDPGQFLAFMSDEANKEEAVKLGLGTLVEPTPPNNADLKRDNKEAKAPGT